MVILFDLAFEYSKFLSVLVTIRTKINPVIKITRKKRKNRKFLLCPCEEGINLAFLFFFFFFGCFMVFFYFFVFSSCASLVVSKTIGFSVLGFTVTGEEDAGERVSKGMDCGI